MEDLSYVDDRNLTMLMKRLAEGKVGLGKIGRPRAIMVKGRRRTDKKKEQGGKEEVKAGESEGEAKGEAKVGKSDGENEGEV